MKRLMIITSNSTSPGSFSRKIKAELVGKKCEVHKFDIWESNILSIDASSVDFAITCLPDGHTKLPDDVDTFMASLAGSPFVDAPCLVATYSKVGLNFYRFKSGVEYNPDKGKGSISLSLLVDENSDKLLHLK